VLLSIKKLAQMGRPAFPFIDQGKDLRYTGEGEKEKKVKKRALGLRRPSPPQAGLVGPADDNRSVHTSQPYPSLVLQAGAIA
jgi:hypothetical protein